MRYVWGANVGDQEGETEGKRSFGKPKDRQQENIEMNLNVGWDTLDWINVARGKDK